MVQILVVDDEPKMARALKEGLEADDYSVRVSYSGEEGFYLVQSQPFDLMILDVMLPGHDGFEILATLRKHGNQTPVLLLTARDGIDDRVRGLDSGADDYMVKPFAFPELLARTRALLRRAKPDATRRLALADLEMDTVQRRVTRAGQTIELTAREFDVLEYLFTNSGRIVSREMLARDIWKETSRQTPIDNVIDAQIVRLRRKIDNAFEQKLLRTVRGVGICIARGRRTLMSFRPKTLRARLTLWYLSVLAALLVLAWGGTSVLLFFRLRSQLDHFAIEEIETVEGLFHFGPDGTLGLREDYHNHAESKNVIERFVEVLSPDGAVLFRDSRLRGRALDGMPRPGEGVGTYSARSTHLSDGTRVRAVSRSHVLDGHRLLIRLAHTEESMRSQLWEMWLAWLLALPFVLAAAGGAGYALAGRVLSPIDEIVRRAREITPDRLHERLQIRSTDDELGRLVSVFNDTLARLEQAFEQAPPVHFGLLPRTSDTAGDDPQRRRGRASKRRHARGVPRDDREHAGGGKPPHVSH